MFFDDILRALRLMSAARKPKATTATPRRTLIGKTLFIHYEAADGFQSYRDILVTNAYRRGPVTYFEAYCWEAETELTFRADRVVAVIDKNTGRQFNESDAEGFFRHHFRG